MKKQHLTVLALLLAAGGITAYQMENRDPAPGTAPLTALDGAALYAENCAACHGVNLEGEPNWRDRKPDGTMPAPPHDDSGHTWHHPDAVLFAYTKFGGEATLKRMGVEAPASGMPGFGHSLSDAEIIAVLDFIKSRWSERSRAHQSKLNPPV